MVPLEVVQKTEVDAKKAEKLRGTTKAAVLRNDPTCPSLICCSVYDTKPVHLMSTVSECVQWDQKYRRVWSADVGKHVMMKYLRLNLIDLYNNHMNSVDLADQLRNCYRMNHWFRNRKWWWAIFQWALGVAATNAYIMYERIYEEEAKNKKAMPRKWNHLEFLVELIYDFMGWASDDVKIDVEDEMTPLSRATLVHLLRLLWPLLSLLRSRLGRTTLQLTRGGRSTLRRTHLKPSMSVE
jgi:hypothetical protein